MAANNQQSLTATSGGVLACLIWGSSIAVMGILARPLGPLSACGYECLIAGLILICAVIIRGKPLDLFMHPLRYYLICGGFWLINFSCAWLAVSMVNDPEQLVVVGMFNYLWPILTLLGSLLILGKKAHFLVFPGIVVTIAGLILSKAVLLQLPLGESVLHIVSLFGDNPGAYLVATIDALAWALYSNLSRRLANPQRASAVPLFMLIAAVILISAGYLKGEVPHWSVSNISVLFVWSIASAIAYLAWDIGMREGNVVAISSFSMLIPLLSTLITCIINQIAITAGIVAASLCLVGGALLCKWGVRDIT